MAVPGIRQVPRQVDMESERRIVTLAITSTPFLRGIFPFMREEFLQVPYARRAYGWARDYFRKYNEAPVGHVQDLYEIHKGKMDPDEASLLGGFLLDVSERYEADGGPETVNVDFELDRATEFAKKADILARSRRAEALVQDGRVQDAEREMGGFRTLSRITSPWVNPNDPEEVKRAFRKSEEDRLVRFPGKLGMLLGWFKRGWLIAVQGPSKRGKSWWLQEIRTLALMNRLRVVEVNLEMTREQLQMRYYKRISNAPDQEDGGGRYLYPVFDCQMNQLGTCSSRSRASSVALYEEGGRIPSYKDRPEGYVHCDCCRDQEGDDYVPATWWEEIEKEALTEDRTIRMVNAFGLMYGSNNYRMLCYPRFGATVGDLNRDLDILYETEGFAPDVIIPDYADIFGAENPKRDPRDRIDETWMALARMGTERHSLVATGTHSNLRRVEGKKRQRAGDVSEDTRKVNHLDLLAALDQTDSEKVRGIMRVGLVAYRHGKFNPNKQVTVLQNLDVGQVALDSEWDYGEREE